MAKYTIDLYTLLKDDNFKIFNFDYDFYTDDINIKQTFESKFIDRYMFNEIGFETVARFKHYLKERLNSIAPYYKQLYYTELESKNIKFLLNKDLTETFIKDVENESSSTMNNTMTNTNNLTSNIQEDNTNKVIDITSDNTETNSKESNLDNGNADLGLNQGNLTGVSSVSNNNTINNDISTTDNKTIVNTSYTNDSGELNNLTTGSNREKETTKLISQGNIGVTSSAELLKQWREVLINIDNMIIEECKDLFMQIY